MSANTEAAKDAAHDTTEVLRQRMNRARVIMTAAEEKDFIAQQSLVRATFYAKATANARETTIAQHEHMRAEYYAALDAYVANQKGTPCASM